MPQPFSNLFLKMRAKIKALAAAVTLATGVAAAAGEPAPERPVLSAFTAEAGSARITETYLSPIGYSGSVFGLGYERMQAMKFNPDRWVMRMHSRISAEFTHNPVHNASMQAVGFDFGWGMMWRTRPAEKWTVTAGGSTGVNVGAIYNARNSNNPVAAKASWTVNATAGAVFNTSLLRVPVCLRYIAELPLTGIFFSPAYGELYYEIYLGNRSGLVRGAWPGNFFRLDNLLTADFRFNRTILRLGYRCGVHSSEASHIVTRRITHTFVLGVASEWLALGTSSSDRQRLREARIISSLY